MNKCSKQKGFSIVELMVAMVLGLVISAAAVQIFASNKSTYRLENALSRLQENGRFVVDRIAGDLRMAGYNGCLSRGTGVPTQMISVENPPFAIDGTDSIRGFNNNGTGWLPAIDASLNLNGVNPLRQVVAGTDVINVQRASSCGVQLTSAPTSVSDLGIDIVTPNDCNFNVNSAAIITNCSVADVFQISATGATLNRVAGNLSAVYAQESQVFLWESNAYYIATNNNGVSALFRSSWNPSNTDGATTSVDFNTVELAEGVEDMQILYGIDQGVDEYADTYVTANDPLLNWGSVKSVRISLLLASDDFVTSTPRQINFNGANVNTGAGADRRLRTVYTTTISLRNTAP